eukprot:IDg14568t1
MTLYEKVSESVDEALSKLFGDGPVREINMKLSRNIAIFGGAVAFFKIYGHQFEHLVSDSACAYMQPRGILGLRPQLNRKLVLRILYVRLTSKLVHAAFANFLTLIKQQNIVRQSTGDIIKRLHHPCFAYFALTTVYHCIGSHIPLSVWLTIAFTHKPHELRVMVETPDCIVIISDDEAPMQPQERCF